MGTMRSEVCSGMFRSSTNLAAFENMLSALSDVAKTTGPDATGGKGFDRIFRASRFSGSFLESSESPEIPKVAVPVVRDQPKVGRNDPCPCGSGKNTRNAVVRAYPPKCSRIVPISAKLEEEFARLLSWPVTDFD